MENIGVIVGNGRLPLQFIKEAERQKLNIFPIGLFESVEPEIKKHHNYKQFQIGDVKDVIKYFLHNDIKKIVMLGKVEKDLIFKNTKFDEVGEKLLSKLPDRKDETLLFGVILLFRLNGIKVLSQNYLLKKIMSEKKCYTKITPTLDDEVTIKIGIKTAKALSKVDAGQSVLCKKSSVVALEGIEGTDKTIERAFELAGEDTVLIKMARPQQDMRVDVPAIGIKTIKKLVEIKAKGVVIEADRMLFLEQDECIKLANDNNMFIVGR